METLAGYVTRIMQEKQLRPKDVERRSGDQIDDAYVIKIMKGITTNPSIRKTQALAQGLGVSRLRTGLTNIYAQVYLLSVWSKSRMQ